MSENQIFNKSLNKGNNILYQEIDRYVAINHVFFLYAACCARTELFVNPLKMSRLIRERLCNWSQGWDQVALGLGSLAVISHKLFEFGNREWSGVKEPLNVVTTHLF